jgi:hypothetical protein
MRRILVLLAIVSAGAAGLWAAAQKNAFGVPKTIIHVSLIKWKDGVPEAEKQKALNGVKEMASQIPGIKNVWIKAMRVQPQDFHAAFVIEFENQAAHDRYAKDPVHDVWTKHFLSIREASISPQITND